MFYGITGPPKHHSWDGLLGPNSRIIVVYMDALKSCTERALADVCPNRNPDGALNSTLTLNPEPSTPDPKP